MNMFAMQSDEDKGDKEKPYAVPGVDELLEENPVKDCLRLYYHKLAIDMAVLVVGGIYLGSGNKDMIPVYMVVRSAIKLCCLPLNIAVDFEPSFRLKKRTVGALVGVCFLVELVLFAWLIFGTVIVSKRWPGSDKDVCNKPCYLTAFSSIIVDWIWKLLFSFAVLFPLCWFVVDQWTLGCFLLYASAKKSKKHDDTSVQNM